MAFIGVRLKGTGGGGGGDGREVELDVQNNTLVWRYVGDTTWTPLYDLTTLQGEDGDDGGDGREVELSVSATHIRWRYAGDTNWTNLISLSALRGPPGSPGQPGPQGDPGFDYIQGSPPTSPQVGETWLRTDPPQWEDLALNTGWTNQGGDLSPLGFRIEGDRVRLRGVVAGDYDDNYITRLPVDARPSYRQLFSAWRSGDAGLSNGRIDIQVDGYIRWQAADANPGITSLDGVVFFL